MPPIFKQFEEIFIGSKADVEVHEEVDDEADDETDKQPDATDIPELETEESTEQMLSRLPISLA